MIKVKNLNKYYNKGKNNQIHVINNASLEIKETGLVAFLGKSGSGKTTLLNVIGGLDRAKGSIKYEDIEIKNYAVSKIDKYRKENIGYVFQNYSLIHKQTVQDNLRISLNLIGIHDDKAIEERIKYALTSVGMFKYRKRLAGTLSGGQQQRVAIARALVKNAKIIIADEPTGNLDSENTIEVLNILKQISKTRLVLLVTHDTKLAGFYADRIIELKDGVIVNDYDNSGRPDEYNHQDNRNVYLGDLKKEEINLSNINMTKYEDEEMPEIDLKIVYSKGNIYIESPLNIKLIGANTPMRLMEGKHEKMTTEDIKTNYDFDFKEIPKKKKDAKSFFKRLWLAIKSFFLVRNRTYLLYIAFIVIGMLMSLCAYNIGKYTNVNIESAMYAQNAYIITNKEKYNDIDEEYINTIFDSESGIEKVYPYSVNLYTLMVKISSNLSEGEISVYSGAIHQGINEGLEEKLVLGKMPEDSECVIDKIIAERIIEAYENKNFHVEMEDLINSAFIYEYKITGVVDTNTTALYTKATDIIIWRNNIKFGYYEEQPKVDIFLGKNITNLTSNEALFPIATYSDGKFELNDRDSYNDVIIENVGFYVSDEMDKILVSKNTYKEMIYKGLLNNGGYMATAENTKITEGRLPKEEKEIVIPDILDETQFQIGSQISLYEKNYTIVGKYETNEYIGLNMIGKSIKGGLMEDESLRSDDVFVYTNNISKTKKFVEDKGYTITNSYDYVVQNQRNIDANFSDIFFIIFLLIETILFVYFMMRAKMISKIKDIGIYRALGARKKAIIKDFLIELIVLTTFTTMLGYIMGSYFIVKSLSAFNILGDIFVINIKVMVMCGVGFYFINIIFGLLPIFMLLRKTPSEIIAKYDI